MLPPNDQLEKYYAAKFNKRTYYVCPSCKTAENVQFSDFYNQHEVHLVPFQTCKKIDILKNVLKDQPQTTPINSRKTKRQSQAIPETMSNKNIRIRTADTHSMSRKVNIFNINANEDDHDITNFLHNNKSEVEGIIRDELQRLNAVKVNLFLESLYTNIDGEISKRAFKTKSKAVLLDTDISEFLEAQFQNIINEADESESKKSGWTLSSIIKLSVRINKYSPIVGSSYIPLPNWIAKKKACINVQNYYDQQCFKYAVLTKMLEIKMNIIHIE